jgi:hypothetical protein
MTNINPNHLSWKIHKLSEPDLIDLWNKANADMTVDGLCDLASTTDDDLQVTRKGGNDQLAYALVNIVSEADRTQNEAILEWFKNQLEM